MSIVENSEIGDHQKMVDRIIYHDWVSRPDMSQDDLEKLRMLRPLRATCKECQMCRLGRMEHIHNDKPINDPHVFSTMTPSQFMVVGQNPGYNECVKDEPFVGDAGEFFNKTIEENGLSRKDFYVTNAVKCHSPENRKPEADEVETCLPFLLMEMRTLRPVLVITLGATAFDILCPGMGLTDNLGTIIKSKYGVKVYPVYHPSPRNMADPSRKSKFQSDIYALCELIKRLRAKAV